MVGIADSDRMEEAEEHFVQRIDRLEERVISLRNLVLSQDGLLKALAQLAIMLAQQAHANPDIQRCLDKLKAAGGRQ